MSSGAGTADDPRLRPVDATNWRGVADLETNEEDRRFVAEPSRYLALCCYGTAGWRPLALSYEPANVRARSIYARLGFVETDEREGAEIVARLDLDRPVPTTGGAT